MDTRDGSLHNLGAEDWEALRALKKRYENEKDFADHLVPAPKVRPGQERAGKVGRNGPCPCGSGRKFKRCCMGRAASAAERSALASLIAQNIEACGHEKA